MSESTSSVKLQITPRPSHERGNADHGWLKTFHTFSFADYYDPKYSQWGSLRVINEDRVSPKEGFGTHPHREFEIFSYIVSGELEHRDSLSNVEVMRRGDVQLTSAGTGVRHSEKTFGNGPVHFLQIWALPWKKGLTPAYFTRHFKDDEKKDKLVCVVAPAEGSKVDISLEREGTGPTPVQSSLYLWATLLSPGKKVEHSFVNKKGYVHLIQTSGYNSEAAKGNTISVNGESTLREGDGVFIEAEGEGTGHVTIENTGDEVAEVLLFDIE